MRVDILTLCDSAQEYNGKLVIVGTFNTIKAKEYPSVHSGFSVVARIIFDEDERENNYDIEISIKKENEDVFVMPLTTLPINVSNFKGENPTINLLMKGQDVQIPKSGTYIVRLKVCENQWESKLIVE